MTFRLVRIALLGSALLRLAIAHEAHAQYASITQNVTVPAIGFGRENCSGVALGQSAAAPVTCDGTADGYLYHGSATAGTTQLTSASSGSGSGAVNFNDTFSDAYLLDQLSFSGTTPDRLFLYFTLSMQATTAPGTNSEAYANSVALFQYALNGFAYAELNSANGTEESDSLNVRDMGGGILRAELQFEGDGQLWVQASSEASPYDVLGGHASGTAAAATDLRILGLDLVDVAGNSLRGQSQCTLVGSAQLCNVGNIANASGVGGGFLPLRVTATPEPTQLTLLATGLLAVLGVRTRRRR